MANADGRRYFGVARVIRELTAAKNALKTVLAKRGKIERVGLPTADPIRKQVRELDATGALREVRELDATGALRDTENALRDFISAVLSDRLGPDWINRCGVTPDRVQIWTERKATESGRFEATRAVEERLIYYADFYDLKTILRKNWSGPFAEALGEWKTMEVWFGELERMRDPDAHRRELLPHQKYLVVGIAGEIRTRLVRYRSKRETAADCFPRIESVRDSLGNIWTPAEPGMGMHSVSTKASLRPGDQVDFVITARDPEDAPLEYASFTRGGIEWSKGIIEWSKASTLSYTFTDRDIAAIAKVDILIRSNRQYHAAATWDDLVTFYYQVLPPRRA